MQFSTKRPLARAIAALFAVLLAGAIASPALAQPKSKVKKDEGKFVSYNEDESTVTVKLKGGKEQEFNVKAEGSVLTRTTVSLNATPAKVPDIPAGAPVIVYWIPDKNDKRKRFARKIDAPKVPEELLDQYD